MIFILEIIAAYFIIAVPKRHKPKVSLRVLFFIDNHFKHLKFMKLNKHQFTEALLSLVNEETNEPIETTFSNVKFESSDEAVFKIEDADSDGDLDVIPVGPGVATLLVSAVCSYTDPNNGEPIVAGKDADPVEITVINDPASTKLKATLTDARELPLVEAPAVDAGGAVVTDANAPVGDQGTAENGANLDAGTVATPELGTDPGTASNEPIVDPAPEG